MSAQSTRYTVDAENRPGGAATISSRTSTVAFDGSAATGELLPGPADLLAAGLAACILKNVERFSGLLPFRYDSASVRVEVEREEPPPRIVRARYTLRIVTDEPDQRLELLHRNIVRFGTVTNTTRSSASAIGFRSATVVRAPAPAASSTPGSRIMNEPISEHAYPGARRGSGSRSMLAEGGELCVCDLAWISERAQNLVSHHLRVLRDAALARSRREGKMVMFSLTPEAMALVRATTAADAARQ